MDFFILIIKNYQKIEIKQTFEKLLTFIKTYCMIISDGRRINMTKVTTLKNEKDNKDLDQVMAEIEKQFGKGSIM